MLVRCLFLLALACAATAQPALIPAPAEMTVGRGGFEIGGETEIVVAPGDRDARRVAVALAALVGTTVDSTPQVTTARPQTGAVRFVTDAARDDLGAEGYQLSVTRTGVVLTAAAPAGLFYGVQTIRQLLPPRVEYTATLPRSLTIPAVEITDRPRYPWRGMMLDVARHFFQVEDVERVIDLMALYKLNRLHLHLSDDQGWRVEIPAYPDLTRIGGRTQVGGGPGGYYTTADYDRIVAYAAQRFVTIVPEIDLPGHTNAALASVPELNCDGVARPPYTGTQVGFSSVCVDKESTYAFVDAVVRQLAAQTPGDVIHLGGDEVERLSDADYARFMRRAQAIVTSHGKRMMGWDEMVSADLEPGSIVQVWQPQVRGTARGIARAVRDGAQVVLSPADRIYLDMKYDDSTILGITWAGRNGVRDAYDWEPSRFGRRCAGVGDLGRRGAAVVGDHRDDLGHRVPGLPPAGGRGRDRLVAACPVVARVPPAAGQARPALGGAGRHVLPLARGLVAPGRRAVVSRPAGGHRARCPCGPACLPPRTP